ncbi:MAG TPA: hypothetical protein VE177_08370 [Candidatus Binatus sp.]|nr:hypothetical protein [Candidatus Binatus sp.]
MLSKPEAKASESELELESPKRTAGMSFASIFYIISGVYYVVIQPVLTQDLSAIHLYAIGILSILAGFLLLRVNKWGFWLGLLLFPVQIVTSAFGFEAEFVVAGGLTSPLDILFLASLIVLIFFASVTFLVLLDQRKNFESLTSASDTDSKSVKK